MHLMAISRRAMLLSATPPLLTRLAFGQERPLFTFHNRFWLNLHHFLYVLGRARNKASDSNRGAVIGAISDGNPLETLSRAVSIYSSGASTKDAVFDRPLAALTKKIASLEDGDSLPEDIDPGIREALRDASAAYRRDWWPRHSAANAARILEIRTSTTRYGNVIGPELAKLWTSQWPSAGFDVQVSAYANWGGAYSTQGGLIVLSSLDPATAGSQGLEIVFHEAMHQWDDDFDERIGRIARASDVRVPPQFSHSLIFYTAGYVVSKAVADHQPYAIKNSLWNRGLLKMEDLDRFWRPYLEGRAALDDSLRDLLTSGGR